MERGKYRKLQGTYPVLALSFAAVKADNLEDAKTQIKQQISKVYAEKQVSFTGRYS